MLENEGASLAGRVHELERKVLEQGDEIVCLRATLAHALRRLSILENVKQTQHPTTPLHHRNGNIPPSPSHRISPNSYDTKDHPRIRQQSSAIIYRNNKDARDPVKRASSYVPSPTSGNLSQRRAVHYQSTGSLHSDSPSSSSVSPVPSPSPRATPLPKQGMHLRASPVTSGNNLHLAKRWTSVGDFNVQGNGYHNSISPSSPSPVQSR